MSVVRTFAEIRKLWLDEPIYRLEDSAVSSRAYPLDLQFTLNRERDYYEPKDGNGIPQRRYASVGVQYSPTRVAAYGFANFNHWLRTKQELSLANFKKAADWFLSQESALYTYKFPWDGMPAGWVSAMAQGEAISLLRRAFETFGDSRYRDHALLSAALFRRPISEGGVLSNISGAGCFPEEYPQNPPRHALNGALYAIIGLADLELLSKDAFRSVNGPAFVSTLEDAIDRYDLGFWSSYDLHTSPSGDRNPATIDYHSIHVAQLKYLGARFRKEKLLEQSARWHKYSLSFVNRCKAFILKLKYRSRVKAQR